MKKVLMWGMLLGLLSGVCVAQRGRATGMASPTGRPGWVSPTARPLTPRGWASPTAKPLTPSMSNASIARTTPNATVAPNRTAGATTTVAPNRTTGNTGVDATAAPRVMTDPLAGASRTAAPDAVTRAPNHQQ